MGRAAAGTTATASGPVVEWATNTDWLNIDPSGPVGTFTNSATIADGLSNPEGTGALGAYVFGGASIDVFVNDGMIAAVESGQPVIGNTTTSFATATGLWVDGDVPSVVNNGTLAAVAWGFEHDDDEAVASADAIGAYLDPDGLVIDFTNNDEVHAEATARATSDDDWAAAGADAVGVYVDFEDRDGAVESTVNNAAQLTATASATAIGKFADSTYAAAASATVDGVFQEATNVDSAWLTVGNTGDITVSGESSATAHEGFIGAVTYADGIDQEVEVDEFAGLSAVAEASNTGMMTVAGSATASGGTFVSVRAEAEAGGIEQDVEYGGVLSAKAANLGSMSVEASATAEAFVATLDVDYEPAMWADAAAAGIDQDVDGSWEYRATSASAVADNQGALSVSATSSASGTYVGGGADEYSGAAAEAAGIAQTVSNAQSLVATATNTSALDVVADASASFDVGTYAGVTASAAGVSQSVDDEDWGDGTAQLSFANSGSVSVVAGSSASFEQGGITGSTAFATGSVQSVYDVAAATLTFENGAGSSLSVVAGAQAESTYAQAGAFAVGAGQSAYVDSDDGTAVLTATNLGTVAVAANVRADGTYAVATGGAHGILQEGYGSSTTLQVTNSGALTVAANVVADGADPDAEVGIAVAQATYVGGVLQSAEGASASAVASNTSSIQVTAQAQAVAATYAAAGAAAVGVAQDVYGGTASVAFTNTGTLVVDTSVEASNSDLIDGGALGIAFAVGVAQNARGDGDASSATATVDNQNTIAVTAEAVAAGATYAVAEAMGGGVSQSAYAANASAVVLNSGAVTVNGIADAQAESLAVGFVSAIGIDQDVEGASGDSGSAQATVTNSSDLNVLAQANAAAATYAFAVGAGGGVAQDAYGDLASATFSNTGTVVVTSAVGAESDEYALALGQAAGITQYVSGGFSDGAQTSATATADNDGAVSAGAQVAAGGLNGAQSTYAMAFAGARGIDQMAQNAGILATSLSNSSSIVADADASATGDIAVASANAVGYSAEMGGNDGTGTATFLNESTGAIWGIASAVTTGGTVSDASALAAGVSIGTYGTTNLQLDAVNDGLVAANALATSTGGSTLGRAEAIATGVRIDAWDGQLAGTFTNSATGVIAANAVAAGVEGSAEAVGIASRSFASSLYITNRGLVSAYAEGPTAMATGILIDTSTSTATDLPLMPVPAPVATIENHGDIWAGISTDGGQTVLRGNAIMTENAPNPVTILLENDDPANIFGNIDIGPDDQIIVQNGHTKFDGIINPDLVLEGNLTIRSDGKLSLLNDNPGEGPSKVYVNGFDMGKRGTLQLHLTQDNTPGTYPTITTNVANLRGKLAAHYQMGVLYGDTTIYDNVISAGTRNGQFEKVVDNSILLKTIAIYDNDQNVDLKLKRVAFNDVSGLTKNQKSAASGIEKVYGDLPNSGPFSNIVKDLFSLSGAEYAAAMDQLAGAEYAQLMQSVLRSNGQLNGTITDRMDCAIEPNPLAEGADARKGCFDPNKIEFWARVGGGWNTSDGDVEAPGYDEQQTAIYVGGDYAINTNVYVGLAGGYFNSSMDFDDWGGRNGASINYDGGQVALYGGYDDGTWYGRNILSYGFYSGTSQRDFGITSTPRALKGEFDTNVVSYYGEAGRRFQLMENVGATPFLGLGLASAGIGDFTEKDPNGTGAALRIRGSDASSVATTLGFRVNGYWGGFRPEVTLAWQHEFADARQTVDMAYAGAPKGANFSVISSDPGSDALLLGAGISYAVSRSSVLTVRYDGSFWSGYNSQELMARFTSKF